MLSSTAPSFRLARQYAWLLSLCRDSLLLAPPDAWSSLDTISPASP
jgi:hypothetical protein